MNILSYLESEFSTFEEKPFNPLDSALLSQFCMVRCESLVPSLNEIEQKHTELTQSDRFTKTLRTFLTKLPIMNRSAQPENPFEEIKAAHFVDLLRAERYASMFTGLVPGRVKDTLLGLAASPRFRTLNLYGYESVFNEQEQNQFAAITFVYTDQSAASTHTNATNVNTRTNQVTTETHANTPNANTRANSSATGTHTNTYTNSSIENRSKTTPNLACDTDNSFAYIGFRGTDTSVTGWRENFNMAFTSPVPAQEQAVRYLESIAPYLPKRLFIGGHSKGANLALYAALKASPEIQQRIERVYVHDGPGFKEGAISEEEWRRLEGRIYRSLPQESVVGLLMNCPIPYKVVNAQEHGLDQHSPFTWEVNDECNDFSYAEKLSDGAQFFDAVFNKWLAQHSDSEAAAIVDALFRAIEAAGVTNASEIFFGGLKTIPLINKAAQNLDNESGAVLHNALGSLAAIAANEAGQSMSRNAQSVGRKVGQNAQSVSQNIQNFFANRKTRD